MLQLSTNRTVLKAFEGSFAQAQNAEVFNLLILAMHSVPTDDDNLADFLVIKSEDASLSIYSLEVFESNSVDSDDI